MRPPTAKHSLYCCATLTFILALLLNNLGHPGQLHVSSTVNSARIITKLAQPLRRTLVGASSTGSTASRNIVPGEFKPWYVYSGNTHTLAYADRSSRLLPSRYATPSALRLQRTSPSTIKAKQPAGELQLQIGQLAIWWRRCRNSSDGAADYDYT